VDNSVNGRRLTETVSTDESQVLKRGKRRRSVEMMFGQKHRLEREAHPEEEGRLTNSSYKIAGTFFDIKTDDGWIFTICIISFPSHITVKKTRKEYSQDYPQSADNSHHSAQ
jgi:hypothetical protein